MMYQFNPYSIPNFAVGFWIFIMGAFLLFRRRETLVYLAYFAAALWVFGCAMLYSAADYNTASFWLKFIFSNIILIPPFFYNFIVIFCRLNRKALSLVLSYSLGILFMLVNIFTNYIVYPERYWWGYFGRAGSFVYLIFLFWFGATYLKAIHVLWTILKNKQASSLKQLQLKYLMLAYVCAFLGGVDFLVNSGFIFYPFGYLFVMAGTIIISYSIIRYRLMDITVAVTRTTIFIAVYTLVLGLPFAVALSFKNLLMKYFGANWWIWPLGLMAALATSGPFIYIFFERKAEDRLLKEQRRYQETLKQASVGMTRIRDLKRLLDLIAHIVTKTVRIAYAGIYLYDVETDQFLLQVSRDKGRTPLPKLTSHNPLITWINLKREPLVYEEIKRQMQDSKEEVFKLLEENMRSLYASVVVPSFLDDRFMGFIVLGDKVSGKIYTREDLDVFQVLASQAALAIENAQFYEETKQMQEQVAQAEKMATIGTMADGLSHQINNRFYALSLIAGDTIDTIKTADTSKCSPEVKEMIEQVNHALDRIQSNVIQGGEVVKGILKYTRKGEEGFAALALDRVIDGTLEMVQYKIKLPEIDIVRGYPKDIPQIRGNLVQLQEVFFNFIDNAYDAIVERRTILEEDGYRGRIAIFATPKEDNLEIIIEDNGMGIKDDSVKKIFTPFFTTKTSSRKGTGLGLYVIRRIIADIHKGKIAFESAYRVGTRFIIELPMAV